MMVNGNMKTVLLMVAFSVLATVAFAQQSNGPFGLHRGMTQQEVIQIIGKDAIKETKGDIVRLIRVPKPHSAFESYDLIFSPKDGLLKIIALGIDIRTNGFGEAVHQAFKEIRDAVSQSYGKPDIDLDYLKDGSIWKEPEDWTMGLLKDERTLACAWKMALPNRNYGVVLEAKALSNAKGYLTLMYEFDGWNEYVDSLKKKAGAVF
jgi:hypothetical protein